MGKEHELLEAARTGNLPAVKTILSGKQPRSGGLRSWLALKHVNINCKDASGETPVHLAALNGHGEVVQALLAARATVTEVDCQGCTPLHLAAWNGHADICDMLLQHASDKSIVNAQTNEGETPLHFAAQHGHLNVVSLLLQNKADPTYRTLAERSALDLAAQYGKTGVVRTLVTGRHELLTHVAGQPSPLHLAAFNGHLPIVGFLLNSGFPVNTRTDNGTALHEAATSCKLDVIKLLLDRGVDVWAKAKNNMTAEDILRSTQSRLTHEALQIINGHVNSQRTPDSDGERDINGIPGPGRPSAGEATPPSGGRPVPKPRSVFRNGVESAQFMDSSSSQSSSSEPQSPPPPLPPRISLKAVDTPPQDTTPVAETGQLAAGTTADAGPSRSRDASPMSGSREQPKKPPRKTPSMRRTEAPSTHSAPDSTSSSDPSTSVYDRPRPRASGCELTVTDPVATPDLSNSSSTAVDETSGVSVSVSVVETVSQDRVTSDGEAEADKAQVGQTESVGDSVSEKPDDGGAEDTVTTAVKRESIYANATVIAAEEETKIGKPQALQLEESTPRESTDVDQIDAPEVLADDGQPPTPDYPPPSPIAPIQDLEQMDPQVIVPPAAVQSVSQVKEIGGAEAQVVETVEVMSGYSGGSPSRMSDHRQRHLSQGSDTATTDKTGTTTTTMAVTTTTTTTRPPPPPPPPKPSTRTSSSSSGSSVMTASDLDMPSTVEVEGETVEMRRSVSDWDSNVFAGLLRGSTPGGPRNVVSQICENVVVKTVRSRRRSTPSTIVTFDPLMEREEDRDVFDADRVLDEIEEMTGSAASRAAQRSSSDSARKSEDVFDDSEEWAKIAATLETFGVGMARESVFVREYEASFTKSLAGAHQKIQSVGEWLDSFGLGQYENTLVANGFDDTDFLGGSIIEDQDLAAIGITNEDHRTAIVTAAQRLPPVQPIDQRILPESVEKWLESLRLGQYLDTFVSHKYNTMLRVIKLWELELNTVLDISSLGHRKRILASLGDRRHLERDTSMSPARVRRRGSEEDEPRSPFEHIDLYRDYTGVKAQVTNNGERSSPKRSVSDKASEEKENNGPGCTQVTGDTQIHIRPPHLMHTTGSIRQWRHRPEVLIKGCCNYTAHYLGSTVVKELKGATSTQEGIAKLKKSTEVISKIPTIMLSISYKGVKFIDAKSKRVICDHEIANIFCACQDGDHMNFFAYVTKDKETSRHYCHVFSVRSREQAGEIILTLGEAFEIAYQMALKEKAEEDNVQLDRQPSHSDQDDTTSISSRASVSTV